MIKLLQSSLIPSIVELYCPTNEAQIDAVVSIKNAFDRAVRLEKVLSREINKAIACKQSVLASASSG